MVRTAQWFPILRWFSRSPTVHNCSMVCSSLMEIRRFRRAVMFFCSDVGGSRWLRRSLYAPDNSLSLLKMQCRTIVDSSHSNHSVFVNRCITQTIVYSLIVVLALAVITNYGL